MFLAETRRIERAKGVCRAGRIRPLFAAVVDILNTAVLLQVKSGQGGGGSKKGSD